MKPAIWHNCYDSSWKGVITDASFQHPAKFGRGLIERIFDHCLERGYLRKGDICADVFGGIGTGGITAAYRGLRWVGLELEKKFVSLGRRNFALHTSKWRAMGLPRPVLLQGDSRKFHLAVAAIVSSPPYAESNQDYKEGFKYIDKEKMAVSSHVRISHLQEAEYGQTPDQIGRLRSGEVAAVISSPPFTQTPGGAKGINVEGYNGRSDIKPDFLGSRTYQGQGGDRSNGNIEVLKPGEVSAIISSPPYAAISTGAGGLNTKPAKHSGQQSGRSAKAASQDTDQRYGKSDGQIARLKGGSVEAVVTSPPWEANDAGGIGANKLKDPDKFAVEMSRRQRGHAASPEARKKQFARDAQRQYGDTDGQIGKEKAETYWAAMDQVYRSCFKAIKPGGVIVLVVKDYVKDKQRVPLCDDTARLIENIGFTVVERIHAMLVKETHHYDLFEANGTTDKKSRKSFFRRLAEAKGSPEINFEEVIIAKRP